MYVGLITSPFVCLYSLNPASTVTSLQLLLGQSASVVLIQKRNMGLRRRVSSANSSAPLTVRRKAGERYKLCKDCMLSILAVGVSQKVFMSYRCCLTGGWETAVLALHSVLPPCPAEDQGAAEGLWLLQFLVPERERPPLQIAPSSPPSPTQTQQFTPQVCPLLCHFSLHPHAAQSDC